MKTLRKQARAFRCNFTLIELLFVIAIIGGSIGSILGMQIFRHKTRHWYFVYGMPLILILQIALVLFLIYAPIQFSIM